MDKIVVYALFWSDIAFDFMHLLLFNKTESSKCAFYKRTRKDKSDGTYWMEAMKDGKGD